MYMDTKYLPGHQNAFLAYKSLWPQKLLGTQGPIEPQTICTLELLNRTEFFLSANTKLSVQAKNMEPVLQTLDNSNKVFFFL